MEMIPLTLMPFMLLTEREREREGGGGGRERERERETDRQRERERERAQESRNLQHEEKFKQESSKQIAEKNKTS